MDVQFLSADLIIWANDSIIIGGLQIFALPKDQKGYKGKSTRSVALYSFEATNNLTNRFLLPHFNRILGNELQKPWKPLKPIAPPAPLVTTLQDVTGQRLRKPSHHSGGLKQPPFRSAKDAQPLQAPKKNLLQPQKHPPNPQKCRKTLQTPLQTLLKSAEKRQKTRHQNEIQVIFIEDTIPGSAARTAELLDTSGRGKCVFFMFFFCIKDS